MLETRNARLVAAAVTDLATPAGSVVVAIDGATASGKTILADAVAAQLDGCEIVHADDFYRPMPDNERERLDAEQGYRRYFDWERLREQVLVPLRDGRAARYQIYDWGTGHLGAWREIRPGTVVLVEGVYSARPELAPYYHFAVLVDTPRAICLQRAMERGQNPYERILRWRAAEDFYLSTTRPQDRVQLVVSGC
jgi:uridine kinase